MVVDTKVDVGDTIGHLTWENTTCAVVRSPASHSTAITAGDSVGRPPTTGVEVSTGAWTSLGDTTGSNFMGVTIAWGHVRASGGGPMDPMAPTGGLPWGTMEVPWGQGGIRGGMMGAGVGRIKDLGEVWMMGRGLRKKFSCISLKKRSRWGWGGDGFWKLAWC